MRRPATSSAKVTTTTVTGCVPTVIACAARTATATSRVRPHRVTSIACKTPRVPEPVPTVIAVAVKAPVAASNATRRRATWSVPRTPAAMASAPTVIASVKATANAASDASTATVRQAVLRAPAAHCDAYRGRRVRKAAALTTALPSPCSATMAASPAMRHAPPEFARTRGCD